MTLAHFTDSRLIVAPLVHRCLQDIVGELVSRLENCGYVQNGELFKQEVLAHEHLVSAVYDEIACASARSSVATELSFAVGLARDCVAWGEKSLPVRAVILFAVPPAEEEAYSSLVVTFAGFFKSEQKRLAFLQCTEPAEMIALLEQVTVIWTGPRLSGWER